MGKKTSKTTSTTAPPTWATPIIQNGANSLMNTYTGNQGNLQSIESGLTGSTIPGIQSQIGQQGQQLQPGYNYINQTMANNPGLANPANGFLQSTLGGQYLNSNPYTQAMAQFAGQQAGNAVNSAFSSAGRTGSGDNVTDTARGVDQAANQVLFQNYQNERGLQNQAAGQLSGNYNTGIGAQSAAAGMLPGYSSSQFAGYSPLLGAQQLASQVPYAGSSTIGQIGSLLGNYGTQTSKQPGGVMGGLLGAASNMFSFSPIALSDRRLKTNIEKVGEAKDGLGIYTWKWRSDPAGSAVRGVIADEVEKLRPWAFVPNFKGEYAGVNYAALGSME